MDSSFESLQSLNNFQEKTGLGIDLTPLFCIAKLKWFQMEKPKVWKQVKTIKSISDFLTLEFTGAEYQRL